MNVQRLIDLALSDIGVSDPTPAQYETAFDHLNMIISNFGYWNPDVQPIDKFTALSDVIQLPNYYIETFELMLAAREALGIGSPASTIQMLEMKVKQLTDRLVYRRISNQGIGPTTQVV